jgi:hypothetical protein
MLMGYAYTQDARLTEVFQRLNTDFPIPESGDIADLPVYAEMSYIFWNAMSITNNLHLACEEVQTVIERRPEAVDLLNRYGSRNPKYEALDLCPF